MIITSVKLINSRTIIPNTKGVALLYNHPEI